MDTLHPHTPDQDLMAELAERVHNLRILRITGANQATWEIAADDLNRTVADLVDEGVIEPEDAWALGATDYQPEEQ